MILNFLKLFKSVYYCILFIGFYSPFPTTYSHSKKSIQTLHKKTEIENAKKEDVKPAPKQNTMKRVNSMLVRGSFLFLQYCYIRTIIN
jgi:hypothetical protein